MTINALDQTQIEIQKIEQLKGIHYQLSRIGDILGRRYGEPKYVDMTDVQHQLADRWAQTRQ